MAKRKENETTTVDEIDENLIPQDEAGDGNLPDGGEGNATESAADSTSGTPKPLPYKPVDRSPPALRRMVIYVLPDQHPFKGEERAAVIARVNPDGTVNLCIFDGSGADWRGNGPPRVGFTQNVKRDDSGSPGTWHW